MRILLFSDGEPARKLFKPIARSRTFDLEIRPRNTLIEFVREPESDCFLYVDIANHDTSAIKRLSTNLTEVWDGAYGVVDLEDLVVDVAELFAGGARDYIGSRLASSGLSTARLRRIVVASHTKASAAGTEDRVNGDAIDGERHIASSHGAPRWGDLEAGRVYDFFMVFVGIDGTGDLRRKASDAHYRSVRERFRHFLENYFSSIGGRIWMWREDDGLILFPHGGTGCDPLIPLIRLILNRPLITIEQLEHPLSWRLALHLGNTTYSESGNTGEIVSEAVNFIFHAGDRLLNPGSLVITEPVFPFLPEGARSLFEPTGTFEGVETMALRSLQPPLEDL